MWSSPFASFQPERPTCQCKLLLLRLLQLQSPGQGKTGRKGRSRCVGRGSQWREELASLHLQMWTSEGELE